MSSKKIIFKIKEFPHLSETFIIAQIVSTLNLCYNVEILIQKEIEENFNSYNDVFEKYNIKNLIVKEDYNIPQNTLRKIKSGLMLFFKNKNDIFNIIKFYYNQEKFSFSYIFHWDFYAKFNDENVIFHIQYGDNKNPLDILKSKCGFKAKVITTFHGHDAFFPIYGKILNNRYYDNLFNHTELITVNTQYLFEKLIDLGCKKNKIKIVPVGVDTFFFKKDFSTDEVNNNSLKIINIGRFDPIKGQLNLIEIANKLKEKKIKFTLTIIGDGKERKNIEELIDKYKLMQYVILAGKKTQTDIKNILLKNDIYFISSISLKDGRSETQGLATLEAQACGLPVLAYDSGGVKYTLLENKTGFLFKENEHDKVVEKIIFLNENRDILKKMGNQAVDFVDENYSQKVINLIWDDIYKLI